MKISKSGHAINFQKTVRLMLHGTELLTKNDKKIIAKSVRNPYLFNFTSQTRTHFKNIKIQKMVNPRDDALNCVLLGCRNTHSL